MAFDPSVDNTSSVLRECQELSFCFDVSAIIFPEIAISAMVKLFRPCNQGTEIDIQGALVRREI